MGELFTAFGINWKLLVAQAVNFGALLFILWYFLYGPVLKIIDERRARAEKGVRDAEEAERTLAASHEEGAGIVGKAAREAEGLVAHARERAEEKGSEIVKNAEAKAGALIDEATARAGEARRQALLTSEKEIARAAMLAAEKILQSKAS